MRSGTFLLLLLVTTLAGCQGASSASQPEESAADSPASPISNDPPPAAAPGDSSPPADDSPISGDPVSNDEAAVAGDIYAELEGYGTSSSFGIGGDLCRVTSLGDAGPGTLRACIEDRRSPDIPLEVQFDVAGTITLGSMLRIDTPNLTINGSTAPAPGITIQTALRKTVAVIAQTTLGKAHDVLISHLRIRGSWDRVSQTDVEHDNTIVIDCENNDTGASSVNLNIVLNRMTLMNSPDGGPDAWGACRGITVQRSFIHHNVHPMTISAGSASQLRARLSIHHNVFWNNAERNPQIRGNVQDLDYVNNIIGGWQWYGVRIRANSATDHPQRINLLSNVWVGDGTSRDATALEFLNLTDTGVVYTEDNLLPAAETDRGGAGAAFGNDLRVTRYASSQLADVVIGSSGNYAVGTVYPTAEESALLADIRARL